MNNNTMYMASEYTEIYTQSPAIKVASSNWRGMICVLIKVIKAPLLGIVLGFQRPELLSRGRPFGVQERGRFTRDWCRPSLRASSLMLILLTSLHSGFIERVLRSKRGLQERNTHLKCNKSVSLLWVLSYQGAELVSKRTIRPKAFLNCIFKN